MRSKNVVKMLTFFTVLGIIALFGVQVNSQTVETFIESIENTSTPDTIPEKYPEEYDGPQTVKALMNAFDAAYNQKFSKAKVIALCKDGVVYSGELAIRGEIDARHSRVEWLRMLLQRGITIEDFDDYRIYLSKRHTLAFLEDNSDLQEIGFLGIPLTDDQAAYKVAYIDKLVHNRVQKASKQIERLTTRIERYKKQLEQAKKQLNSKRLKQAQAKLETAKSQLEDARKQLKRIQEALEHPKKSTPTSQN